MTIRTFTAVLHKEDDLYVAECPEVGTISQGHNMEEAVANMKEATELYLEEFSLPEASRPLLITFEVTYDQATPSVRARSHSCLGATGLCASTPTRESCRH